MSEGRKIAMWSGPRNLSTAMMYSFGNRADCAVVDEPFYAAYLAKTGIVHPMQEAILASQSQDPDAVVRALLGPNPEGKPVFYQKHMTQHMVDGVPREWMREATNVFLIRHPARVIASYGAKRENPSLEDIGFPQQAELIEMVSSWGQEVIVLDSADIRRDPEGMLRRLCEAVDLKFDPMMLQWPKGGHAQDGVWASHWYGAVWDSTGFAPSEGGLPEVDPALEPVLAAALPIYEAMKAQAL